jgi:hypothetical protein
LLEIQIKGSSKLIRISIREAIHMRLSTPAAVLVLLALGVSPATACPINSGFPGLVDGRIAGLNDRPAVVGDAAANFPNWFSANSASRLAVLASNRVTSLARDVYDGVAGIWAGQYPPANEVSSDPFRISREVPEPSSSLLVGLGLILIWIGVRRRRPTSGHTGRKKLGE